MPLSLAPYRKPDEAEVTICTKCQHRRRLSPYTTAKCGATVKGTDYTSGVPIYEDCRAVNTDGRCPKFEAIAIPFRVPKRSILSRLIACL